jgi:predicted enzyme related to lactoylglutathione lyase
MQQHPVVWFEVMGADASALQSFYSGLFNWQFTPVPDSDGYGTVGCESGGIPGGVGQGPDGSKGWGATFYISVSDIAAKLEECVAAGASVLMPPLELPDMTIAMLADPEGHPFGLAQSKG